VSGEGVQQALLKIMEGTDRVGASAGRAQASAAGVPAGRHHQHILFVCGGAFAWPRQDHFSRGRSTSIGFGAKVLAPRIASTARFFREVEPEDLLKYGLIPNSSAACRWSRRWRIWTSRHSSTSSLSRRTRW
jgi:ATP-dependent Clp protease ATP-binding subunit ClpX